MKNLFSLCKNKSVLELSLENHLFSDEFFKQANPAIYHAVSGKSEEKVTHDLHLLLTDNCESPNSQNWTIFSNDATRFLFDINQHSYKYDVISINRMTFEYSKAIFQLTMALSALNPSGHLLLSDSNDEFSFLPFTNYALSIVSSLNHALDCINLEYTAIKLDPLRLCFQKVNP